ncbi:MAG: 3-methyl-2-oxobutanoate hydroxymethyltransferase, partial [Alphaproteobacteria bacterium]
KGGQPIVALTAYTAPMARALDGHADLLLVGDTVGMVLYGYDSTLPVTLRIMIAHGRAVVAASHRACVVIDLPFGSYQESPVQAFRSAARVLQETGAQAVKLEGGLDMAETVAFLVRRGIPVMGHVGLQPQSVNTVGGYRVQGRDAVSGRRVRDDAQAIAAAGAFALVVEAVAEPVARAITAEVPAPTLGIGASAFCDGQILVSEDMLGLNGPDVPRFVTRYARLDEAIEQAAARYAADVRARRFPQPENIYPGNAWPPGRRPDTRKA